MKSLAPCNTSIFAAGQLGRKGEGDEKRGEERRANRWSLGDWVTGDNSSCGSYAGDHVVAIE